MSKRIVATDLPQEDVDRLNWLLENASEMRFYDNIVLAFISHHWITEFFEAMGYDYDDGTIKLEYNGTDFVKEIQHDLSDKELELLKETQDD